jgi:hypothetical protein
MISSFTPFCGLIKHRTFISIFICLLRLALCPKILSILEKVPWAAEKNVYSATIEQSIL